MIKDFTFRLGILLVFFSLGGLSFMPLLAKFIQYKEFEVWGSAFTESNDYLLTSPIIYIEIFIIMIGLVGLFFMVKRFVLKKEGENL